MGYRRRKLNRMGLEFRYKTLISLLIDEKLNLRAVDREIVMGLLSRPIGHSSVKMGNWE